MNQKKQRCSDNNLSKQKKKLNVTNRAYLRLMSASYILITAVILSILIPYIFVWFDGYTRQTLSNTSDVELEHWDALFQQQISSYNRQLENACRQTPIRNYIYANESTELENYQAYLSLHTITSVDQNIDCVIMFRQKEEIVFLGPVRYSEEEQEYLKDKLFSSKSDRDFFIFSSGGHHEICLFSTDRNYMGEPPVRGIMITVDLDKLEKTMNPSDEWPLLVFDNIGNALFDQGMNEDALQQVWSSIEDREQETSVSDEDNEIRLGDNRYIITTRYDEMLHLTFCRLIDYNANWSELYGFTRNLYFILAIIFMTALVLSFVLTKLLYRPIQRFTHQLGLYTLSAEDGQSSASQMTTDTSERILNRVSMLSIQYRSDSILSYLTMEQPDSSCPESLNLAEHDMTGRLVLFWVSRNLPDDNLIQKTHNYLEENLPGFSMEFCWDKRSVWFVAILKSREEKPEFLEVLRHCIAESPLNVLRNLSDKGKLYGAVSSPAKSAVDLNHSFRELMLWTKYSLFYEQPVLLEQDSRQNDSQIPEERMEQIYADIRAGKQENAIFVIPGLLDALGKVRIGEALKAAAAFCLKIENIADHRDFTDTEHREKYLNHYMKINTLRDRYEMETYLRNLISDACLENRIFLEKNSRLDILQTIDYIGEHYCDSDISVERVADEFSISSSYFSHTFNDYVGKSFPEYVTDLRMNRARELLLQYPKVSIKKVAEACGYSGVSYFSSLFRKKYGLTPSQLRSSGKKQ